MIPLILQSNLVACEKTGSCKQPDLPFPVYHYASEEMLVDDDRDILFTFKSILAAEGFKVEAFADPNEALKRFTQAYPSYYNLVITDLTKPKINGFQLYQKLKEIKRDIRVLFMTAFEVPGNLLD